MSYSRTHRRLGWLIAVVVLGACALFAQQAAPPPYVAPPSRDVLAGKAPLRLLVASRLAMLAWKGEEAVRVTALSDGKAVHTAAVGEQVGLVFCPTQGCPSLRQNFVNFLPLSSAIRLDSEKPIKLWTPTPDTWTVYTPPLVITPVVDNRFSVARVVSLEEYLRTVVPVEMPSTFHPQALRAQAVVARTYTLCKLGRHADDGADLCGEVHCQVSGGEARRTKQADEAVRDTRGLILLDGDAPASTYYHACCGGVTGDAGYLWGPDYARPYLRGGTDATDIGNVRPLAVAQVLAAKGAYCQRAGSQRWTRLFTAAEVDALVARNLSMVTGDSTVAIRRVTNLAVESYTPNGRVATLRVEGDGASVLVYGDQVRWLFGNGLPGPEGLWSTLFELTVTRDAIGAISGYFFRGAGRGHGIGLCQWGADGRGAAGQNFREILRAYYPGTRLSDEKK